MFLANKSVRGSFRIKITQLRSTPIPRDQGEKEKATVRNDEEKRREKREDRFRRKVVASRANLKPRVRAEGKRNSAEPNVGEPAVFPSLSSSTTDPSWRARSLSSPPASLARGSPFVAVCFHPVLAERRRLSCAVPFDDLSLPPAALFSSLSPDKRQHAALAQLPVVTSSALDALISNKSAVNT